MVLSTGIRVSAYVHRYLRRDGMREDPRGVGHPVLQSYAPMNEEVCSGSGSGTAVLTGAKLWRYVGGSGPGGLDTLVLPGSHLIFVYDGE